MDLNSVDRIELSKEQLDKILLWRDENKDLVREFKTVMPEGLIDIYGASLLYFEDNDSVISYKMYGRNNIHQMVCEIVFDKKTMKTKALNATGLFIQAMEEEAKRRNNLDWKKELIQDTVTVHASLMAYIRCFKTEVLIKNEDLKMTSSNLRKAIRHNRNNPNNVIRLKKFVYSIPNTARTTFTTKEKREIIRKTESWSVKGHHRKYKKNGIVIKEIWVKPYIKGEGTKKAKVYKFDE